MVDEGVRVDLVERAVIYGTSNELRAEGGWRVHVIFSFGYETGCVQKSRVSKGGIPKVYTPPF